MNIVYISGSPRKKNSNTDYLMDITRAITGGELVKLVDFHVEPCRSCWGCLKKQACVLDDDFSSVITPRLLQADAIILGSPVYFNNVSAQLKAFMDRTWSLRGQLRNKIGGSVVVGRRYGAEGATSAIHAFFLKHEMIPANRGVCGEAFNPGEIRKDNEAKDAARRLGERIIELDTLFVPDSMETKG